MLFSSNPDLSCHRDGAFVNENTITCRLVYAESQSASRIFLGPTSDWPMAPAIGTSVESDEAIHGPTLRNSGFYVLYSELWSTVTTRIDQHLKSKQCHRPRLGIVVSCALVRHVFTVIRAFLISYATCSTPNFPFVARLTNLCSTIELHRWCSAASRVH